MAVVCEEFRISRKTGHNIFHRCRQIRVEGPIAAGGRMATSTNY